MRFQSVQDMRIGKIHIVYGVLYPLLLLFLSLMTVNQGVDLADSMYSLSSSKLFMQADGSWNLFMAYYLANFVGFLFTRLPFGNTLLGMNVYTSLVIFATSLTVYVGFGKKSKISYDILFLGEVIALCLQWCPSTVLYNFFSYFLWTIALYLLRVGLIQEKRIKLFAAGMILGANVFTKFTNITAAIFIVLVIYWAYLNRKDKNWFGVKLWKQIGACVGGFVLAFGILFLILEMVYGTGTYLSMVQSLFGMTDVATDYTFGAQIQDVLYYYCHTFLFFAGMILAAAAGMLMLRVGSVNKVLFRGCAIFYVLCIPVLFRLFYGRGLFGVDYEDNFAVVLIGALFCWIAIFVSILTICMKKRTEEEDSKLLYLRKLDACMILLLLFITPLGSNNGLLPVMNNLYLIVPITISLFLQIWKCQGEKGEKNQIGKNLFITFSFTMETMFAAFLCLMLIQGILYHVNYTFHGQDEGQKRDTRIENNTVLEGMKTNAVYAQELTEMLACLNQNVKKTTEKKLFTYGYLPGAYFLVDASPVLSTSWPDLDSFSMQVMAEEMEELQTQIEQGLEKPIFLISKEEYQKMKQTDLTKKEEMIITYLDRNTYQVVFENDRYLILE